MTSSRRLARVLALAASVALIMAGLVLQPVAAISNGSSLVWLAEPATAQTGETITTEVGKPNGVKIKVGILNGSGKSARKAGIPIKLVIQTGGAAGAVLTGDLVTTNSNGVAVFEPKINLEGLKYELVAKAADHASLNSGHIAKTRNSKKFDVREGNVTGCQGPCEDTANNGAGTKAKVNADADGYLVLGLGGNDVNCGGANDSATVKFDVVTESINERTKVTITMGVGSGEPYDVCFTSPDSTFTAKGGGTIPAGSAGLLANCVGTPGLHADPCVENRIIGATEVDIVFSVPPGDPRAAVT